MLNQNFEQVNKNPQQNFHPDHYEDLKKSGLTDQTILEAGIRSVPPRDIDKILSPYFAEKVTSLLAIPYDHGSDFCRYKLFPSVFKSGHKLRYYQPAGSEPHVYIPPHAEKLSDSSETLYITEGEKKALRWSQEGFTCSIAIGGCWSWKDSSSLNPKLISDFSEIPLRGRKVIVIPDSDFQTNLKVRYGYLLLSVALLQQGADVWFSLIPPGAEEARRGLDDYLQDRHTAEDALSHLVRVDLDFLRKEEVNFDRLHFINERLQDILNGASPDDEEQGDRIKATEVINSSWKLLFNQPAHTCKNYVPKVDIIRKGKKVRVSRRRLYQHIYDCPGCAWERGREIAMELALNFPLGFFYMLIPSKKNHDYLRQRITREGGHGARLRSEREDKKIILSSVKVDPAMEFLTWDNPLMIELFRRFLSYEPDWKRHQHKYDTFGESTSRKEKKARDAREDDFQHLEVKGELEDIEKSLELLGRKVSDTGEFELSEAGEWFFDFITGKTKKLRYAPLPYDDPLWRAKVLRS